MALYRLVAPSGHWKYNNNMIFSNIVWVASPEDARKYTLIDDYGDMIPLESPIEEYMEEVIFPNL